MKRSFIAISVATIIGLSACSTKVSSSTSMNSPISTSVTSEQEFLSNLENASTSQVLQKLKESDGGYTTGSDDMCNCCICMAHFLV